MKHQPKSFYILPLCKLQLSWAHEYSPLHPTPKENTKIGDLSSLGLLMDTNDQFSTFISTLGIGGLKCHYLLIVMLFMQALGKHFTSQQITVNKNC